MWLNPTPFGSAQSITARVSAEDCEISASRPGGGGICAREAFSFSRGTAIPKECGPSTRTPVRAACAARSSAAPGTIAAKQFCLRQHASWPAPIWSGGTASTAS